MTEEINYIEEVMEAARDTVRHFMDEVISQLREEGEASNDLMSDYEDGDGYHHENNVDYPYQLLEAAQILDWLSAHKETDNGLWLGLDPVDAIACQAAYTYGNAVMFYWCEMIQAVNKDMDGPLGDLLGEDDPGTEDQIKGRISEILEDYT